jgi:hypothetical protein
MPSPEGADSLLAQGEEVSVKYVIAALAVPLVIAVLALAGSDSSNAASSGTTSGVFVQCLNIGEALAEGAPECGVEVPLESTNSVATLFNTGTRLTVNIVDRHLEANNAYTVWWIIFNDPSGCVDGCGGPDIFAELATANAIVVNATGGVSSSLGNLVVTAWIDASGATSGSGEVFAGDLATLDIANAVVHMVIRSHGPASSDADILAKQIGTLAGGCTGAFGVIDPDGDHLFPCWDPHAIVFAE